MVERSFAAFNNANARALIGDNYDAPLRLIASPVTMPSNYADMLATMIPLVLVLMTMAGAVYPAIDLTAGERERGTMEALVVSPTPSFLLLLAKYSAVVTVSLLTALANLLAMTITLWASGMGKVIFGQTTLSLDMIGQVLALLVLFTDVLLSTVVGDHQFRAQLQRGSSVFDSSHATSVDAGCVESAAGYSVHELGRNDSAGEYRVAGQAIADGCCGMEHSDGGGHLHGDLCGYGAGGCKSLVRFGRFDAGKSRKLASICCAGHPTTVDYPKPDQMALTMAVLFPMYFIASSVLPSTSSEVSTRLAISAAVSFGLILGLPVFVSWYRRLNFRKTFLLNAGTKTDWMLWLPAMLLLGVSAWTWAHEVLHYSQFVIGKIDAQRLGGRGQVCEPDARIAAGFCLVCVRSNASGLRRVLLSRICARVVASLQALVGGDCFRGSVWLDARADIERVDGRAILADDVDRNSARCHRAANELDLARNDFSCDPQRIAIHAQSLSRPVSEVGLRGRRRSSLAGDLADRRDGRHRPRSGVAADAEASNGD